MKLTPTIHRIGNDIVAAYLVTTPEGITVIDAGLPGHWNDLLAELSAMGKSPSDIKGLILTHGDSDHIGFAERLRREHGVPVYVHASDASRAKGGPQPKTPMGPIKLGPILGFAAYSIRKGGLRATHLTEVIELQGGETLDLPGAPQIISLPGHSDGSIAIYVPVADAVFVGDGLTTRHVLTGKSGPAPAPFTDYPDQAITSLPTLVATHATWVLPGHGAPWSGGVESAVRAVEASAASTAR
ncbi:MAG: fold metallo-hydrolase [Glaciihabitans sp.]|nr:fold metallo-hydrolase [Glaciihabitans sp.]